MSKVVYSKQSAVFNPTNTHRHCLERVWDKGMPMLVCVGVNPSSAGAEDDDPTIRKVVGFASRWKFGGIIMVNLYSFVATEPVDLKRAIKEKGEQYAIGDGNDHVLVRAFSQQPHIWFAWGAHGDAKRGEAVYELANACQREPFCIGTNQDGSPTHPLMASYQCPRRPWYKPT